MLLPCMALKSLLQTLKFQKSLSTGSYSLAIQQTTQLFSKCMKHLLCKEPGLEDSSTLAHLLGACPAIVREHAP